MARHVIAAASASLLLLGVPLADAGKLGKVGKSISNKQGSSGSSSRGSGGSSRSPRESTRDRRDYAVYDNDTRYGRTAYYGGYVSYCPDDECSEQTVRQRRFKPELLLSATYQNVRDSDGSLNLDARLASGPFSFGFNMSGYYEDAGPAGDVRMTMWEGNIGGKAVRWGDATELWLTLGVNGLQSNTFDNTIGGAIGAELNHRITPQLSIGGRARGMMYPDDLNGTELRATVTASVLHVGYRHLKFNVGPALQGPELGISLRF